MIMNDFGVVVRIVGPLANGGGRKRGGTQSTLRRWSLLYWFCHHTALSLFENIEVNLTTLGNNWGGVPQDRQLNRVGSVSLAADN